MGQLEDWVGNLEEIRKLEQGIYFLEEHIEKMRVLNARFRELNSKGASIVDDLKTHIMLEE